MSSCLVTLLSDFGLSDVYVGVMKGTIAQVNPSLKILDITHDIPPQNVAAGSFCLMSAYRYFPAGTVYIAVVDPGVGSDRRGVAIEFEAGFLVGPDNGLFSGILSQMPAKAAVALTNSDYWRTPQPSTTFHGRDIFAPVGAHLASGVPLEALGRKIDPASLVKLELGECSRTETQITGYIQYIDRFGNLITNIPGVDLEGKVWSVKLDNSIIASAQTYSDVESGEMVAIVGSEGWVEIAIARGNAQSRLDLDWGATVVVSVE